ncbi:LysR family transcriptional regulator [Pararhizobium haloflavum]|uniref:LysR family transcriptional regulator n=1 Tax=Pararhizobium haloflavum TaxID=2037914 RepID=UPI001FDF49BD|nr:LysR family transcriptional regulator [Pararhizobium haloflavum]
MQLETLIAIVEQGSFARAGAALGATQSTVSARIRELERFVGAELFDRSGYRVSLTAKGEEVLEFAHQYASRANAISRRYRDPANITDLVRIGVVGMVAHTWLPLMVSALLRRYPRLKLSLDVGLTRVLIEHLRQGRIDHAIIAGSLDEPGIESVSIGRDEFVWTAAPSFSLPAESVDLNDLRGRPILALSVDSYHYPVIERWFRENELPFEPVISCNNMNVLAELTAAGHGISLLPRQCYKREIAEGRLRVLPIEPRYPEVDLSFVSRRSSDSVVCSALLKAITEIRS